MSHWHEYAKFYGMDPDEAPPPQLAGPDYDAIADRLKDVCAELGAVGLKATLELRSMQMWVQVEVRHAAGMSDSPDGWDMIVRQTEL